MWLLEAKTFALSSVDDPSQVRYAALSHVWDTVLGEPSFQEIQALHAEIEGALGSDPDEEQVQAYLEHHDKRTFWSKILGACTFARTHGYRYIWIDTCCINKVSSAELSEAVNSMFEWYAQASVCYAYLHDVSDHEHPSGERSKFRSSRWFKRGWTLQELVAPGSVVFLSKNWTVLGTKQVLAPVIEEITHISRAVLTHDESLDSVSVAERMSWASERQTTRIEDEAYSLLGIFGIHMPTIYGEGSQALIRLQEEILRRIPDQSLFAWGNAMALQSPSDLRRLRVSAVNTDTDISGPLLRTSYLFALSTADFSGSKSLSPISLQEFSQRLSFSAIRPPQYTTTSYGLRAILPIMQLSTGEPGDAGVSLAPLACQNSDGSVPALVLSSHHEPNQFSIGGYTFQLGYYATPFARRQVVAPRYMHPRFILLHPAVLTHLCTSSPRHIAHLETIYILHRPPRGAGRSLRFALPSPRPLRHTSFVGRCDVVVPRYTSSYLSNAGYISPDSSFLQGKPIAVHDPRRRYTVELSRHTAIGREFVTIGLSLCDDPSLAALSPRPLHAAVVEWVTLPGHRFSQPTPESQSWEGVSRTLSDCARYHVQDWEGAEKTFTLGRLGKSIRLKFIEWYLEGAPPSSVDRDNGENASRAAFALEVTVLEGYQVTQEPLTSPIDATSSAITSQSPTSRCATSTRETAPSSYSFKWASAADTVDT